MTPLLMVLTDWFRLVREMHAAETSSLEESQMLTYGEGWLT